MQEAAFDEVNADLDARRTVDRFMIDRALPLDVSMEAGVGIEPA